MRENREDGESNEKTTCHLTRDTDMLPAHCTVSGGMLNTINKLLFDKMFDCSSHAYLHDVRMAVNFYLLRFFRSINRVINLHVIQTMQVNCRAVFVRRNAHDVNTSGKIKSIRTLHGSQKPQAAKN